MQYTQNNEQELTAWCKMLYDYTKQMAENPTKANKWIFDKASHDEWILSTFPKHLASVKAYDLFYNLTGQDIRNYNWLSTVKTKQGETITIHKHFTDEHLTTAYDFKNSLLYYYKQGSLTVDLIKDLIQKQRLCWITKQENQQLNNKGYVKHRNDPLQAYKDCGIEIYNAENENLQIMKPEFCQNNAKKFNSNIDIRTDFFNQLKQYFDSHSYFGMKFQLVTKIDHAYIYNSRGVMINTRVKDGSLNDICVYLYGNEAKEIFDNLKANCSDIENELGYNLVWDRNDNKKSSRIGRFGLYSSSPNKYGLCNDEEVIIAQSVKPFDFDLEVENVANELVRFMQVFIPRINLKKTPKDHSKRLNDFDDEI